MTQLKQMLLFGAFVWMNRNSCDQKLGNTRQDGDQVLCVILLCSYIHKTFKKNVEVLKFSFSRKVSKTKGEEKQHKAKRLKSKKILEGEKIISVRRRNSLLEI